MFLSFDQESIEYHRKTSFFTTFSLDTPSVVLKVRFGVFFQVKMYPMTFDL